MVITESKLIDQIFCKYKYACCDVCYHSDGEAIENLKALMTLPKKVINELGMATW